MLPSWSDAPSTVNLRSDNRWQRQMAFCERVCTFEVREDTAPVEWKVQQSSSYHWCYYDLSQCVARAQTATIVNKVQTAAADSHTITASAQRRRMMETTCSCSAVPSGEFLLSHCCLDFKASAYALPWRHCRGICRSRVWGSTSVHWMWMT